VLNFDKTLLVTKYGLALGNEYSGCGKQARGVAQESLREKSCRCPNRIAAIDENDIERAK
jgi:hypothetical protein